MNQPTSPTGVIPFDWIQRIHDGLDAREVRARLGPPLRVLPPGRALAAGRPSLDTVWVYRHDQRGGVRIHPGIETFVGFRHDAVCILWQAIGTG